MKEWRLTPLMLAHQVLVPLRGLEQSQLPNSSRISSGRAAWERLGRRRKDAVFEDCGDFYVG